MFEKSFPILKKNLLTFILQFTSVFSIQGTILGDKETCRLVTSMSITEMLVTDCLYVGAVHQHSEKVTNVTVASQSKHFKDIIFLKSMVLTKKNSGPTTAETGMMLMFTILDSSFEFCYDIVLLKI